jgi:hypothetical protein
LDRRPNVGISLGFEFQSPFASPNRQAGGEGAGALPAAPYYSFQVRSERPILVLKELN